ncbi:MAG: hypothetical protein OXS50_08575 [Gammaproteobacteria bacterium]|nr:hypothetical protein [Gammaproteobacteria bacterium]
MTFLAVAFAGGIQAAAPEDRAAEDIVAASIDEAEGPDVAGLEERLRMDPHDREARVQLIDHYRSTRWRDEDSARRHAALVVWAVEHTPRDSLLGTPDGYLYPHRSPDAYARAKGLWLAHLERMPDDMTLLGNAAAFFGLADKDLAVSLLKTAKALEPSNAEWSFRLGHQYRLGAGAATAPADDTNLVLAAAEFERAYEIGAGCAERNDTYLVEAMRATFAIGRHADARAYAELAMGSSCEYCDAHHQANVVLGRIALAEGDVATAREHLLAAGRVEGSPVLGSFGPNMALARDLLQHGEREAVLAYFDLCSHFWDSDKLADWTVLVRAGRMPDFGGNLVY